MNDQLGGRALSGWFGGTDSAGSPLATGAPVMAEG